MKSPKNYSPLRYPGGKSCLTNFISQLATLNDLNGTYIELYAGGAGAALNLLFNGTFNKIHINDYDYHIYAMWFSVINHTNDFVRRLMELSITIEEWHKQQIVYKQGRNADILDLGVATFFLNRTNRSGVIFKAGPIGGLNQEGKYKIDVRFNKNELVDRIEKIADNKDNIRLTNFDAIEIIKNIGENYTDIDNCFLYLDPPYYNKGKQLYLNNYSHINHLELAKAINTITEIKWMISYDNVEQIKNIYNQYRMSTFDLNYTLQSKKFGSELLVFSDDLEIGNEIIVNNKKSELILI